VTVTSHPLTYQGGCLEPTQARNSTEFMAIRQYSVFTFVRSLHIISCVWNQLRALECSSRNTVYYAKDEADIPSRPSCDRHIRG